MTKLLMMITAMMAGWAQGALACNINPIEVMHRLMLRGPMITSIKSGPAQWAGRTTIASGSASQVVSTSNVESGSLIMLSPQVALPSLYAMQGLTTIASGASVSGVQTTTAAYSGYHIDMGHQNATAQASGQGRGFRVNSLVDGTSFLITTEDGQAITAGTAVITWRIPEAIPAALKVNTISPNGQFTIGWADGKARPVDTAVLWEIKRGYGA